jgi:hypothetical protein
MEPVPQMPRTIDASSLVAVALQGPEVGGDGSARVLVEALQAKATVVPSRSRSPTTIRPSPLMARTGLELEPSGSGMIV